MIHSTPAPIWHPQVLSLFGPFDLNIVLPPIPGDDNEGHVLWLHKQVLTEASPIFAAAFSRHKVDEHIVYHMPTSMRIGPERVSSAAVICMLKFLYIRRYDEQGLIDIDDGFPTYSRKCYRLLFHLKIFALADMYDITALRTYIADKIDNFALYRGYDLAIAGMAPLIYTELYRRFSVLHGTVIKVCQKLETSIEDKNLPIIIVTGPDSPHSTEHDNEFPGLETVVQNSPGLAFELWQRSLSTKKGVSCPDCGWARIKVCKNTIVGLGMPRTCGRSFVACECHDRGPVPVHHGVLAQQICVLCFMAKQ